MSINKSPTSQVNPTRRALRPNSEKDPLTFNSVLVEPSTTTKMVSMMVAAIQVLTTSWLLSATVKKTAKATTSSETHGVPTGAKAAMSESPPTWTTTVGASA